MITAELVWCHHCRSWRRWWPRAIQAGRCTDCRIPKGLGCCGDCEAFPCACPDDWAPDADIGLAMLADHDALHLPHRRSGPFLVPEPDLAEVIYLGRYREERSA